MGDARVARRRDAHGRVRVGRRARRRGDDDPGPVPVARVVLYHAHGCHLCERARATIIELRRELAFDLEEIDITGNADLEARYRELLPVVEIDGRRAFVYHVPETALRRAVSPPNPSR